ncbi:TPA: hypothetical protein ACH3X2_007346 [Trebouxia sp. C0005]
MTSWTQLPVAASPAGQLVCQTGHLQVGREGWILCYQSLPSAVAKKISEEYTQFCGKLEVDFERVETVFVYTSPSRMPKTELNAEAAADPAASQEANSAYAFEQTVPLEAASSETSQQATVFHPEMTVSASEYSQSSLFQSNQTRREFDVSGQSQGVPAVSNVLPKEQAISHQPQGLSVVSDNPQALADSVGKPSHNKSTSKNMLTQPAQAKPAATFASQKVQAHPALQALASKLQSVPSHPKAAPTSSRVVPSTSEAAPIVARSASKPEPVPSVGQASEPVVPASAPVVPPALRATPTHVKASTPCEKAESASQRAAASSGMASAAPDKARSEKAGSCAKQAAVKPAAKLKTAASTPGTLVVASPIVTRVEPELSVPTTASAALGSQMPLPSALTGASTLTGSHRSAQAPSSPLKPASVPKAAPSMPKVSPSEPLETPSAPAEIPPVAQAALPGAAAAPSAATESPLVPPEAHAQQRPAPSVPIKTPPSPRDLPPQAKATPASQAAAPLVAVLTLPEPMLGPKAAPAAPLEVPSMAETAPSALPLGPSLQKIQLAVPEAAAAASAATPDVKLEAPMRWTQDFGRVLARLSPADSSKAIKLPTDCTSVGFSVNGGLRLQKSYNRVNSQSGIALLKNKKGPEVAFEAFSVLDGFGRPSAPLHASKTLVASILAALDGSKPIARARKDASDEQLGFALQVAFTEALPKALLEGYSASDADLRDHVKEEGTMATVAFVCGRQLVVATAGTSCAYLDTGAHVYSMSKRRRADAPTPGLAPPTVMQATIPEGGARLIMASGPFWDIVTPSQDINNVRKHAAKDAPVKLQAGAAKQGLKVEPTVFVVDLAPATSAAGLIDLQKLCKQKQAQVTQVWQPLQPSSATNNHPEWRCQPATQIVDIAFTSPKPHQPAAVTAQQLQEVEQSAVPEHVQRQQGSVQHQAISAEQAGQHQQQIKQQPGLRFEKVAEKLQAGKQQPEQVADKLQTGKQQPEQVAEKLQTGKQQPEKLPQQASDEQQVVKQQPKKAPQQVDEIQVTVEQQLAELPKQVPEKQQVVQPIKPASAKQHAAKQQPNKLPEQIVGQQQPEQAAQEVSEEQQPQKLPAQASAASQAGKQILQKPPKQVIIQQPSQKPTMKAAEQQQTHKQQSQKLPEKPQQQQQQQPQKKSETVDNEPSESQQQAQQPAEQQVKKLSAVQQAAQQVAEPDTQSVSASQSGPEVGPAMITSPPALSKSAKRKIAQQKTARNRATFGWAVLEQQQLLERAPRQRARRERKQQAELQHEENVKAAEGQHEKMKHAKASGCNPEPEAQGEAVTIRMVNGGKGHNLDSTPAQPQSPQANSSATVHQIQEPQSGNRTSRKGKGVGHGVSHEGSQGRADIRDLQPSSAAGFIVGVSDSPEQQPLSSGRGRGGGRGSSGEQSQGRDRGRGGHSAHLIQQHSTQGHITPPPGLAPMRCTIVREHALSPTRRVNAARAAAARATRPLQVIPLPANHQRGQSDSHSGAQAQGSQAPGHPFNGHGRARGHKGQRAGHGAGPAATHGAVSTSKGSSQPNQALVHEQPMTREARQLSQQMLPQAWQQQRQSGGNRVESCNKRQNAGEQQHDGFHADSLHTMHRDNILLANKNMNAQQTASSNMQHDKQAAVGFRPQCGQGGVIRAPPGLQQGVNNHWWGSDRGPPGLPPGLRHGATGQQQDSVGASPKLPPGLSEGTDSPAASGPEVGPAMMTSPAALSKSAKRRIAQQNTARNRATFGWAVLEQQQLLERAPKEKARRERKQQAELQHEENVKAAEGQHEKMKRAKASGCNPEPEAQGEAVVTKGVNGGEEHNPDSTPMQPQANSSATIHQIQEPQSGSSAGRKGKDGGHGVIHDGSQGRRDTRDPQPSSAAGVIVAVSDPPQQQPASSRRGRGGGRGSRGEQSRGRGRGRAGHSAHPIQQHLTQGHITPPPSLAPVRGTILRGVTRAEGLVMAMALLQPMVL